jgi:Ca-activated chloride channel homolog
MLNVSMTPHREFLPADTDEQKLFLMLKIRPQGEAAKSRPSTTFAFAIDTSGSMYEAVGGTTKLNVAMQSLQKLLHSGCLTPEDRIALIQFDSNASTLIGLTPATEISQIESAINKLTNFSGGTCLELGMQQVLSLLRDRAMTSRQALIFTDGHTIGEDDCLELATKLAESNIPLTALGIGEFNENFLVDLSDRTGGKCGHVVPGTAIGTQIAITDLPNYIIETYQEAQKDTINNLKLNIKTVKGVELIRITRAYPDQAEYSLSSQQPYALGNAKSGDDTVYILEFNIDSRSTARARIAEIGLTYDIPGLNRQGEHPPENVIIQFVAGQGTAAQVDPEVMGYVQQRNITQLVGEATKAAEHNPAKAEELLATARRMTVKVGNNDMLASLNQASDELRKTKKISADTRKTVTIGTRGKTVKMTNDINDEISTDDIRDRTGT